MDKVQNEIKQPENKSIGINGQLSKEQAQAELPFDIVIRRMQAPETKLDSPANVNSNQSDGI